MYRKHILNDKLSVFHGECFPYSSVSKSKKRYQVVVGIGGNVGDVRRRFKHLFVEIKKDKRVDIIKTSLILKNPPFGYIEQDDFFNSIMLLKTSMQPLVFLDYLMRLEKRFGRVRTFANAPRTLDLDIIFFDNRVINTTKLTLPHKEWSSRESVIIPLSGILS